MGVVPFAPSRKNAVAKGDRCLADRFNDLKIKSIRRRGDDLVIIQLAFVPLSMPCFLPGQAITLFNKKGDSFNFSVLSIGRNRLEFGIIASNHQIDPHPIVEYFLLHAREGDRLDGFCFRAYDLSHLSSNVCLISSGDGILQNFGFLSWMRDVHWPFRALNLCEVANGTQHPLNREFAKLCDAINFNNVTFFTSAKRSERIDRDFDVRGEINGVWIEELLTCAAATQFVIAGEQQFVARTVSSLEGVAATTNIQFFLTGGFAHFPLAAKSPNLAMITPL